MNTDSKDKKVVLITGASSGIGEATAKQLLSEGHTVYGAARRIERMAGLKNTGAILLNMDVTKDLGMHEGIKQIIRDHDRIDVLINNAGYGSYGAVEDVPIEEAKRQFEVNIFGQARLTQLVMPHMRKQSSGTIINISSMGGKIYIPLGAWYHATKHALEGFSDCLRIEAAQFGINVIIVEPGSIATEWGGIARDKMRQASGNGAYAEMTKKVIEGFERDDSGSSPRVVADVISKAIRSGRPKTRYVTGKFARPFMFMRWALPDRVFDAILYHWFKLEKHH